MGFDAQMSFGFDLEDEMPVAPKPSDEPIESQEFSRICYIYSLVDPRSNDVRYVGKSIRVWRRINQHVNEPRYSRHDSHRMNWLKLLASLGLRPILSVLEIIPEYSWQERERYWISHFKSKGADLVNSTEGGDGLYNASEATRQKISELKKGNKYCLGRVISEETRDRMREAARGKEVSDEARAKMSVSHSGRKHSEETKAKISNGNKGKTYSEETLLRMSESQKGKKLSEDHKKKVGDFWRGREKSEDHKRKIGESNRATKQRQAELGIRKVAQPKEKLGNAGARHYSKKFVEQDIRDIRELSASGMFYREIAERYGVSMQNIHCIVKRITWKSVS